MSFEGKERPAERRKGALVVQCHLKAKNCYPWLAKSGHPWLAERRKGDLVDRCHPSAKSGHPWLAERRKGDLVDRGHPSAKSVHPWLAERRKGDLVVRCHPSATSGHSWPGRQVSFEDKERPPNVVKATSSLRVTRPQRAAILGQRNVVEKTWS